MKDGDVLLNTIVTAGTAAGLAFMAYGTGWHAALFGFLAFTAHAVGNRLSYQLTAVYEALRVKTDDQARQ